jgi:hypothetical protein
VAIGGSVCDFDVDDTEQDGVNLFERIPQLLSGLQGNS